jgi:hypothetical protein
MAEDRRKEPTVPGTGGTNVPARERTVLGVGVTETPPAPAAPIIAVAPTREKTVLGVGNDAAPAAAAPPARERSVQEPPPEGWDLPEATGAPSAPAPPTPPVARASSPLDASIALDLVVKKPEPPKPPGEKPRTEKPLSEASLAAAGVPRRRGRAWLVVLVVVALAASGVYALRAHIPWGRLRSLVGMT